MSSHRSVRRFARLGLAALIAAQLVPAALTAAPASAAGCSAWMDKSKTPEERAHALLAAMTIDDKLTLTEQQAFLTHGGVAGYIAGNPSLCIPDLVLNDAGQGVGDADNGPSGIQVTAFPAPIAQSAGWDPTLQTQFGSMLGWEAWNRGVNVQLTPGIEINRVPTNGRNWEYMSEDPYLAGQAAAAVTAGLQSQGVVATAKHYMANSQETVRMGDSADVSERTLQEIYMLPYEAAIKQSHLGAVMCSYNRINSVWACESPTTLTKYLKNQLGFDGWVMSDWGANHSTAPSANAGLDMEMGLNGVQPFYWGAPLKTAVQNGQVPMSRVDDMAYRITRTMFQVGLFDHVAPPTPPSIQGEPASPPAFVGANVDTPAAQAVALQVAENGTVLLKNDQNVLPLPLQAGERIAVIGESASPLGAEFVYNGGGSGHIPEFGYRPVTSPLGSMEAAAAPSGTVISYATGDAPGYADAIAAATAADVAVVFAYDSESEGSDRPNLSLPLTPAQCTLTGCLPGGTNQDGLISAVAAANPNTVVVLETGGPVLMPWLSQVKGVMEAWYPGQEGGDAISALLFGQVNPSGKLTQTFPVHEKDVPANQPEQWPGTGTDALGPHSKYTEGIFVGYRWYDEHGVQPLFEFGRGLSYTNFTYSNLVVQGAPSPSGDAIVSFDVTNTGPVAGAEVAQVYVGAPKDNYANEPPKQLRAYKKVFLAKGQTTHLSLPINSRAVSYWDQNTHRWTVENGWHPVLVGSSSRDIRLQDPGLDGNLVSYSGVAAASTAPATAVAVAPLPNTSVARTRWTLVVAAAALLLVGLTLGATWFTVRRRAE